MIEDRSRIKTQLTPKTEKSSINTDNFNGTLDDTPRNLDNQSMILEIDLCVAETGGKSNGPNTNQTACR